MQGLCQQRMVQELNTKQLGENYQPSHSGKLRELTISVTHH